MPLSWKEGASYRVVLGSTGASRRFLISRHSSERRGLKATRLSQDPRVVADARLSDTRRAPRLHNGTQNIAGLSPMTPQTGSHKITPARRTSLIDPGFCVTPYQTSKSERRGESVITRLPAAVMRSSCLPWPHISQEPSEKNQL